MDDYYTICKSINTIVLQVGTKKESITQIGNNSRNKTNLYCK